jgi:hypothetical protein
LISSPQKQNELRPSPGPSHLIRLSKTLGDLQAEVSWLSTGSKMLMRHSRKPERSTALCFWTSAPLRVETDAPGWKPSHTPIRNWPTSSKTTSSPPLFISSKTRPPSIALRLSGPQRSSSSMKKAKSAFASKGIYRKTSLPRIF